jgi:hypothetical protein
MLSVPSLHLDMSVWGIKRLINRPRLFIHAPLFSGISFFVRSNALDIDAIYNLKLTKT